MISKKTHILVFDTALSGITIALTMPEGRVITRQIETAREQAAFLVPMLQEVLEEGGTSFQNLDAIACTIGPGSFTGLRISMTTAKTLGLTLDKPVLGLNTLDLFARHYTPTDTLLIVLETKRQDFYGCYYDINFNPLCTPFAASTVEILSNAPSETFLVGGDCLERFQNVSNHTGQYLENINQPNPEILAKFAAERFEAQQQSGHVVDERIEPLYLRGADTSKPKNRPRNLEKTL